MIKQRKFSNKLIITACLILFLNNTAAQTTSNKLRFIMEEYIRQGDLPGLIYIIADKEKVLETQCLGLYDPENKKEMTS